MRRLALAAAAVAAAAALAPAIAGDSPPPLKFAWPIPSKGKVTEFMEKSGRTGTTRCTATLDKTEDGAGLRLHLSDWEVVDLNGRSGTDPGLAEQVRMIRVNLTTLPDVVIGLDGQPKGVVGLEQAVDASLRELEKGATEEQKAVLAQTREKLNSPESRAAQTLIATRAWRAWVGDWAGRVIPDGERGVEGPHRIVCPDMAEYEVPTRFRRMSGEKEGAGLIKLTRESVLDGEDARPVLAAWMKKLEDATGRAPPATSLRYVDRSLTVADPATLLPKRVMREQLLTLQIKDMPERTDVERHEYTFEWETAAAPKQEPPK